MSNEVKKTKTAGKRGQPETAQVSTPSRVQAARKARDHGTVKNASGSLHSSPNPGHLPGHKPKTDGGNSI
jgi:hypothetical protein